MEQHLENVVVGMVLGGVEGTTASLSVFSSIANIVALACLIMTCSSAANYICDMNGHSKELGMLELAFTEDFYSVFVIKCHLS